MNAQLPQAGPQDGCMYCGRLLEGQHDGWRHDACAAVYEPFCAAAEITDGRDLEVAEADLLARGLCSWQIKATDAGGSAVYCGQDVIDDEDPPAPGEPARRIVTFCPFHQCAADGDEDGQADELNWLVLSLLGARRDSTGQARLPAINGETMTMNTGETYTYAQWRHWAENCIGLLLAKSAAIDTMCAQIAADDGDQAQIASLRAWQAEINDCAAEGARMLAGVAATQVPVGEAVAAAGGSDSTPHKQYADEARSR